MTDERPAWRVRTIAPYVVVALVVAAYLLKADPSATCRYSGQDSRGACSFTNHSVFPVGNICGRVVLKARYGSPHVPSKSEPVCSGFLWPLSTTNVSFEDMDPDPLRACDGSYDNCIMTMEWD